MAANGREIFDDDNDVEDDNEGVEIHKCTHNVHIKVYTCVVQELEMN